MTRRPGLLTLTALLCVPSTLWAVTIALQGTFESAADAGPENSSYRLTGPTTFGWKWGVVPGDIDLGRHTLTMDTGGGNVQTLRGAISGSGALVWDGGGQGAWQTTPSFLTGARANTFTGGFTLRRGMVMLAKPAGVCALPGDISLGGGSNQAILTWDADDQVADSAALTTVGPHEARLWLRDHAETLGHLRLAARTYLDLGAEGQGGLSFGDCREQTWADGASLVVTHWRPAAGTVVTAGVSDAQLARIGFRDPAGREPGLYRAARGEAGRLQPGEPVIVAGVDRSAEAREARRRLYEPAGLTRLCAAGTPLPRGARVAFFGDSLTWQGTYLAVLREALARGEGTRDLGVTLLNHGINGGGVETLRDGADKAAFVNDAQRDGPQAPFAEVLAKDQPTAAVVMIGINDVWWRNTPPERFRAALTDLCRAAANAKVRLVLCTLALYQERPDGTNPKDAACDQYADLARQVAAAEGVTLVDVRRAMLAWLWEHNAEPTLDGRLRHEPQGLLTYDGVHLTAAGCQLLADLMADGLVRALGG